MVGRAAEIRHGRTIGSTMSGPAASEHASAKSEGDHGSVAIVLAGGTPPSHRHLVWARAGAPDVIVVAADSGSDHAHRLGVAVDVAVGDFDSISPSAHAWLTRTGTRVERHPAGKDASDLELALLVASRQRPDRIVVLGVGGGRLDHLLFNLLVLADRRWGSDVRALAGDALVTVAHDHAVVTGPPGSVVSLVAVGGPATVTTSGLEYPLRGEPLSPTSTRGLSNVLAGGRATVDVSSGTVLILQPDHPVDGGSGR